MLAYTIGNTDSYEQAMAEKRDAGETLWKVGRFKPDGKPVTYDDGLDGHIAFDAVAQHPGGLGL